MKSLPFTPNVIKASEQRLNAIYAAAYAGLKSERLATAAGMSMDQYRRLSEIDPQVKEHELRARADAEMEHAMHLARASREGDAKASLAILQHAHGWTARQDIRIDVGNFSISAALEEAKNRVFEHQPLKLVNGPTTAA